MTQNDLYMTVGPFISTTFNNLGLRVLQIKFDCTAFGIKGCRMGRSDKVSFWYVSLLINTRFRLFILE